MWCCRSRAAVGARLADDGGGFAGDTPSLTEAMPATTSPSAGDHLAAAHQHQIALQAGWWPIPTALSSSVVTRRAFNWLMPAFQAVGPRFAAPLGQGLGEVGQTRG